jgi:hypothetical protein
MRIYQSPSLTYLPSLLSLHPCSYRRELIERLSLSKTQDLEAGIYSQALREVLPPPEEPEPEYLTRVYGMDYKNDWAFFSHKNGVRRSEGMWLVRVCG